MKLIITVFLALTINTSFAQNLYGDMETWRNIPVSTTPGAGLQAPVNWYNTDSIIFMAKFLYPQANFNRQTFRSTDSHTGSFSTALITRYQDSLGYLPAVLSNAAISVNPTISNPVQSLVFSGGTPVSQQIGSINAWIKYYPKGADTAWIMVKALKTSPGSPDTILSENKLPLYGQYPSWSLINVPLTYSNSEIPNLLRIVVTSGTLCIQDSSTLLIDDISLTHLGINTISSNEKLFTLYPNPCKNTLHIKTSMTNTNIKVTDISGQVKTVKTLDNNQLDVSDWLSGIYFLRLVKGICIQTESFIVEH